MPDLITAVNNFRVLTEELEAAKKHRAELHQKSRAAADMVESLTLKVEAAGTALKTAALGKAS